MTTADQIDRAFGRSVFGSNADGYHAGRAPYPEALYERIFARCAATPSVVEVGPGTGIATAALLRHGAGFIVGIEPDPRFACWITERLDDDRVTVLNAALPDDGLDDGTFDLAAAASSFHWVDAAAGLSRLQALLVPGGTLALWWNVYRLPGDAFSDALAARIVDLAMPPSETEAGHFALNPGPLSRRITAAGFENIAFSTFEQNRVLDATAMRALYASFSFVRRLEEAARTALLDDIGRLVNDRFGGAALNRVVSPLYLATRR